MGCFSSRRYLQVFNALLLAVRVRSLWLIWRHPSAGLLLCCWILSKKIKCVCTSFVIFQNLSSCNWFHFCWFFNKSLACLDFIVTTVTCEPNRCWICFLGKDCLWLIFLHLVVIVASFYFFSASINSFFSFNQNLRFFNYLFWKFNSFLQLNECGILRVNLPPASFQNTWPNNLLYVFRSPSLRDQNLNFFDPFGTVNGRLVVVPDFQTSNHNVFIDYYNNL